jgi:hypothetical protein
MKTRFTSFSPWINSLFDCSHHESIHFLTVWLRRSDSCWKRSCESSTKHPYSSNIWKHRQLYVCQELVFLGMIFMWKQRLHIGIYSLGEWSFPHMIFHLPYSFNSVFSLACSIHSKICVLKHLKFILNYKRNYRWINPYSGVDTKGGCWVAAPPDWVKSSSWGPSNQLKCPIF